MVKITEKGRREVKQEEIVITVEMVTARLKKIAN